MAVGEKKLKKGFFGF